ncbi:Oidioi.mRNA.OKI2018_I69.chr2.g7953.t1.cds [Oikopleura dioica]|uniref:Oidioi.mRNA.OKI2018_I69.chr2.g7953.t1.cds n=1 Tax=Oikopleura dioica TaxID=34765 RepID=A0ABN7TE42_OIKDI|nr:Oidioi.mRNA.OKI2018_I69.chr2.g7953.t1.cds [Oikopleura dioica]
MDVGTKNPVLDLEALRVSISRTPSVLVILSTITAYIIKVFDKKPASFELVEKNVLFYISEYISPESFGESIEFSISVLLLWLSYSLCYNLLLRWTLTYKGWIFEGRGNTTLFTRVWAVSLRLLTAGKRGFSYFYQFCPHLHVPELENTVRRYLQSMKPLITDKEFAELKRLSDDFLTGVGPALNSALTKKSWLSTNYVTDWWEEYVYLSSRDSLMINSNYFGLGQERIPSFRSTSRIADAVIDGKVPPIKLQKLVPLCPMQYKRAFGTNRTPGKDKDALVLHEQSSHIVAFSKNAVYSIEVVDKNGEHLLTPKQLESTFDAIRKSEPTEAEKIEYLAAGTALSRDKWASIREAINSDAQNEYSLQKIESALFHVWLDDSPANVSKPASMVEFARRCLHGSGQNIWFDKCFSIIAASNGHIGQNVEHTWADGAVILHITEEVQVLEHLLIEYAPDTGMILSKEKEITPELEILKWNSLEEPLAQISKELPTVEKEINNLSLSQLTFTKFGKIEIKKWRLSPDAICQLAYQLTNFKIRNKFSMTYEAALARIFKDGRTETIRSCTTASATFVKEMLNKKSDNQKRRNALKAAVTTHGELTKHAMVGEAVDRHLFALCVASRGLNMEHEFLNKYRNAKWENVSGWELSTSCAPVALGELYNPKKYPHLETVFTGFGWTNGFGIGYIIGDDRLVFSVSSSKQQNLDSQQFCETLAESLLEISALFD